VWMHKITVNTALNYIRDNLKNSLSMDIGDLSADISDITHEESFSFFDKLFELVDTEKLIQYIQDLPPGYRTVFNLYAIENLSHKEIAEELDISVSTSKTQLFKARKILAQKINETIESKKIKMVI
jgi:RNA polymerase sigma-70 factor, ECF subfamily